MTNEEALHNMDNIEEMIIHLFGGYPYTEEEEFLLIALDKARVALEKQIPKKPITRSQKFGNKQFVCSCGTVLYEIDDKYFEWGHKADYCECCGQAIRWEKDNGTAT